LNPHLFQKGRELFRRFNVKEEEKWSRTKMEDIAMSEKKRSDLTLKILAGGLVAAVGVQSYFTYKLFSRTDDQYVSQVPETAAVRTIQQQNISPPPQNKNLPAMRNIALNASPVVNPQMRAIPQIGNMGNPAPLQGLMSQDPFEELERMQEMMERMLNNSGMPMGRSVSSSPAHGFGGGLGMMSSTSPKISGDKDNYVVSLNIPGLEKSNIQTQINGNMLTIAGTQKEEVKNTQGNNFISSGTSYKQFQTSFNLPGRVKSDGMKVDYDKDVLTITIPRA
jgi:HSP20 family protein